MISRRFAIVTFAIAFKHALQVLGVWAIDERQSTSDDIACVFVVI